MKKQKITYYKRQGQAYSWQVTITDITPPIDHTPTPSQGLQVDGRGFAWGDAWRENWPCAGDEVYHSAEVITPEGIDTALKTRIIDALT